MSKEIYVEIDGEKKRLEVYDEHHLWLGGQQYISLNRMYEIKKDMAEELRLLNEKVSKLTGQNEAYKILLAEQLKKVEEGCETCVDRDRFKAILPCSECVHNREAISNGISHWTSRK